MKKETENTNCKKCDVVINCPLSGIIDKCPYIQNYMPIEPVKDKEKEEDVAVFFTKILIISGIVCLFLYWLLK